MTPHFWKSEFACKCNRENCEAPEMSPLFMAKLEALRVDWGKPLSPTSGLRCRHWNALQGGAQHSMHVLGRAADFYFSELGTVEKFAALAEKHGFTGIGTGKHKVHIDDRDHQARWTYHD